MGKALLGIILSLLALPAVSARASTVCGSAGVSAGSRYCSLASSRLYREDGGNSPSFSVVRDGRTLAPVLGMHMLSFDASFPGNHTGVASLVKVAASGLPSHAGRQGFGEGGNGGTYGIGTGVLSNFVPDGWYRRPSGDGWVRFQHSWYVGSTGTGYNTTPSPLDPTPEPMTLVLFGSGLLLIAFLVRRRALAARVDV